MSKNTEMFDAWEELRVDEERLWEKSKPNLKLNW